MLVQSPSRIFKSDLSVWKRERSCFTNTINTDDHSALKNVSEIVLEGNGDYDFYYQKNSSILVVVLYGETLISGFTEPFIAGQIFTRLANESGILNFKNNLRNEKTDILILELKNSSSENSFSVEDLNFHERNALLQISEHLGYPNFTGIYDGRKEQEYVLQKKEGSIFGMVINGAFEFQNRLMETRDAILLNGIETLEFEALSENALLIFLEI
ncbi:hypothetical protein HHL23_13130 [Chryseobacterium sp. RP-3-3]|uniref:Quercetin 2,3-dioxygenase C-terminal cupin domain-containing protein n=1 Tax=Chryseobacterium antibioticum TaxID=2728847 RepID=A0A7Y0ANY3_9FLAO|nr:hypothetical protein [Chryseobacterium antibioticum]NML70729.1 hypothetical protein [Chryseobacterium antibioticum]